MRLACSKIENVDYSKVPGTVRRIRRIRDFAHSEMGTLSGKEYILALILTYVVFTSFVSKGGFPINNVYLYYIMSTSTIIIPAK